MSLYNNFVIRLFLSATILLINQTYLCISLPKIPSIANCIFFLVLISLMHSEFLKIFAEAYG